MKSTSLKCLLNGSENPEEFLLSIENELGSYQTALKKQGGSASIQLEENINIVVGESNILILCEHFVAKKISSSFLEYVCDALELGELVEFENDKSRDLVFEICNPEINGKFSISRAKEVILELKA